jgi:hypothetical protein
MHSAKGILKKLNEQALPSAKVRHSAKSFFKKKQISLPSACGVALGKEN